MKTEIKNNLLCISIITSSQRTVWDLQYTNTLYGFPFYAAFEIIGENLIDSSNMINYRDGAYDFGTLKRNHTNPIRELFYRYVVIGK